MNYRRVRRILPLLFAVGMAMPVHATSPISTDTTATVEPEMMCPLGCIDIGDGLLFVRMAAFDQNLYSSGETESSGTDYCLDIDPFQIIASLPNYELLGLPSAIWNGFSVDINDCVDAGFVWDLIRNEAADNGTIHLYTHTSN